VRQRYFLAAAAVAITSAIGPASAMPLGAAGDLPMPAIAQPVQFWGGWGPRYYDRPYFEPPMVERRYVDPRLDDDEDRIGVQEAITITRSMGYRAISRPRLAGRAWVVDSIGQNGERVRVSIDAYTGRPMRIRQLEEPGRRFPTPPVWSDERPTFREDPASPVIRDSHTDPARIDPIRPERPARPAPNITARAVPVPTPRPNIDGPLTPQPSIVPPVASPPPAEMPVAPPPAASIAPRIIEPSPPPAPITPPLSVEPQTPFTPPAPLQATPPVSPAPEPPTAALPPVQDSGPREEQPTIVAPPVPPVAAPAPLVTPPVEPVPPPAAALPQAPVQVPAPPAVMPVVPQPPAPQASPVPATPQADTAAKPAEEGSGVMIDGRFLGPNGETLPGAPAEPVNPPARR
jgi:hypothetical protein